MVGGTGQRTPAADRAGEDRKGQRAALRPPSRSAKLDPRGAAEARSQQRVPAQPESRPAGALVRVWKAAACREIVVFRIAVCECAPAPHASVPFPEQGCCPTRPPECLLRKRASVGCGRLIQVRTPLLPGSGVTFTCLKTYGFSSISIPCGGITVKVPGGFPADLHPALGQALVPRTPLRSGQAHSGPLCHPSS